MNAMNDPTEPSPSRLNICLLSLPARSLAVMEFFLMSTGRSHFNLTGEDLAQACIFDYDHRESREHWQHFYSVTGYPAIALSVLEQHVPHAVWVQKPASPASLLSAATAIQQGQWEPEPPVAEALLAETPAANCTPPVVFPLPDASKVVHRPEPQTADKNDYGILNQATLPPSHQESFEDSATDRIDAPLCDASIHSSPVGDAPALGTLPTEEVTSNGINIDINEHNSPLGEPTLLRHTPAEAGFVGLFHRWIRKSRLNEGAPPLTSSRMALGKQAVSVSALPVSATMAPLASVALLSPETAALTETVVAEKIVWPVTPIDDEVFETGEVVAEVKTEVEAKIEAATIPATVTTESAVPVTDADVDVDRPLALEETHPPLDASIEETIFGKHEATAAEKADELRYCGQRADVPVVDLQHRADMFYEPDHYLVAVLKEILFVGSKWRVPAHVDCDLGGITYVPAQNRLYLTFPEPLLYEHCIEPLGTRWKVNIVNLQAFAEMQPKLDSQVRLDRFDAVLWKMGLETGQGRLPVGTDVHQEIYLKRWPNMTRFQPIPHALRIAALWATQGASLQETAKILSIPQRYVFAFYSGAFALNLITTDGTKVKRALKRNHKNRGVLSRLFSWLRR